MSNAVRTGMIAATAFASAALMGCGPKLITFDPTSVTAIDVRPVSIEKSFCPGEKFQVEVLATLKDGSQCSSTDRKLGCQGEKDAIIDPEMVHLKGSAGAQTGKHKKFLWDPPGDVLETADTGITMRGWLEKPTETGETLKSLVGKSKLKPVYACRMNAIFAGTEGDQRGPDVRVFVTPLKTPYYPEAALIRVDVGGSRFYYISPSEDEPVHITNQGPPGRSGNQGRDGQRGQDGRSASSDAPPCTRGENGTDGQDGGQGGPGGDGGPGGLITISLDKAAGNGLRERVIADSIGGPAGPGGRGGYGGQGGYGGSGVSGEGCSDVQGLAGRQGLEGQAGPEGRAGQAGPPPVVVTATREAMFAQEMAVIERIETPKKKKAAK